MPRKPSGQGTASPGVRVREPRAEFLDNIRKMLISPSRGMPKNSLLPRLLKKA